VPPVLQAEVRDLTIAGKDTLADGYGQNSAVNTKPDLTPAATYKDRELGLYLQSAGALVEKVRFFHIAGTCCHIEGPEGLGALGPTYQPFDREKSTVRDIWCLRAYRGIEIGQVDTVVGNIHCRALRDWGIKFSVGSTQIEGPMHLYGITAAPAFNAGVTPAPAAWFNTNLADRCWGGPWYVETSDIGMKIDSNGNVLGPIYSHQCMYGNIQVLKSYNTIRDFEITTNASLSGGSGEAQNGSEVAIELADASNFVSDGLNGLQVVITSGQGVGQSRTITDYDGINDIALVTPNWSSPTPTLGSGYVIRQAPAINVAAQENTIINGRIGSGGAVPDGTVAIRIKGTNAGMRQVIRDVIIFGTANSSAPLISVEETLDDSVIIAKCWNAGTFLDLNTFGTNRIGSGNFIWLTSGGTVTKPVNLPPTWNDLANEIWVEGVMQTSPTLELTIASGTITLSQRNHVVDTESDASSDDLTTINGGIARRAIILRAAHNDRTVVVKDGVGNLKLETDFALDHTEDTITLFFDGTNWLEKARANNG
jgi:hypothetical protein